MNPSNPSFLFLRSYRDEKESLLPFPPFFLSHLSLPFPSFLFPSLLYFSILPTPPVPSRPVSSLFSLISFSSKLFSRQIGSHGIYNRHRLSFSESWNRHDHSWIQGLGQITRRWNGNWFHNRIIWRISDRKNSSLSSTSCYMSGSQLKSGFPPPKSLDQNCSNSIAF